MKERKKELRKRITAEKMKYSDSTLKSLSEEILEKLEALPAFQQAKTVLLYHSLKDEVHTHAFIEKWSKKKTILLPVVAGEELELRLYTSTEDLLPGAYGIAEPAGQPFVDYASIDLAVVPGVAFDKEGRRLGRGKGYYDKLLTRIPAIFAGICFPFQLIDEVPAEPFDIRMDTIITQ